MNNSPTLSSVGSVSEASDDAIARPPLPDPQGIEKESLMYMFPCGICKELCDKSCSSCVKISYCSAEHQKEDWKNHKSVCRRYPVKLDNEVIGSKWTQILVATKKILPGQVIFKERSLISGPCARLRIQLEWEPQNNDWIKSVCLSCYKEISSTIHHVCSNCEWPLCGRECEKEKIHADFECKVFAEHHVKPLPIQYDIDRQGRNIYSMITVLRAILMRTLDPQKWQQMMLNKNGFSDIEPTAIAKAYGEKHHKLLVEFIQQTCGMSEIDEKIIEKVSTLIQCNDRGNDVTENRDTYCASIAPKTVSYLFHELSYIRGTLTESTENCILKQTKVSKFEIDVEAIATRTIKPGEDIIEFIRPPLGLEERTGPIRFQKLLEIVTQAAAELSRAQSEEFMKRCQISDQEDSGDTNSIQIPIKE